MGKRTSVSLLISTYNWPKALKICLQSILEQTVLPDEILIADDGSTEETRIIIDLFRNQTNIPVKHIWHEDEGFRLSHIRNKAIAQANCEYIIQIDGDIVLEKNFVKDHLVILKTDHFVVGSRALLEKNFSEKIVASGKIPLIGVLRKNTKNKFNASRIPWLTKFFSSWYKNTGSYKYYTRGCNMAFWKKAIIDVNGYNEDISGWGAEDTELVVRLIASGQKKLFLKFGGVQFHIWHYVASRDRKQTNDKILSHTIDSRSSFARNGIDKYL